MGDEAPKVAFERTAPCTRHVGRATPRSGGAVARLFLVLALCTLLVTPLITQTNRTVMAQATPEGTPPAIRVYDLPGDNVYPQGVAFDPTSGAFYVGSTEDGTLLRGDLDTGEVAPFATAGAGERPPANGLEVDAASRLYVAGRGTGSVFVYDTAAGELLRRFDLETTAETAALNDVAFSPNGDAYVTDGTNPVLYRIPSAAVDGATPPGGETAPPSGELEAFLDFSGTAFAYQDGSGAAGTNADGIVATEDGASLLIVQSNTGRLFRVEIATKEVVEVDLGGTTVANGDGLALEGRTLYVVRDRDEAIVPVTLTDDATSGRVGEAITDPSLDFPTAIALVGDGTALVANHQFLSEPPTLPFVVSRMPLPPAE